MEQKSRALLLSSHGLAYKILGEQSYRFRQRARSDAEGPFDDACLATDLPRQIENRSLPLAQSTHDLKALERCIGRFQRLESSHRTDRLFQLAVISLNDIIMHSTSLRRR